MFSLLQPQERSQCEAHLTPSINMPCFISALFLVLINTVFTVWREACVSVGLGQTVSSALFQLTRYSIDNGPELPLLCPLLGVFCKNGLSQCLAHAYTAICIIFPRHCQRYYTAHAYTVICIVFPRHCQSYYTAHSYTVMYIIFPRDCQRYYTLWTSEIPSFPP